MWQLIGQYLYDASLLISCAIAISLGGRDERMGAAIAIAASGATAVVLPLAGALGLNHARYAFLIIGLATLFAFDRLMIRSRKRWPIVAAGFQLATVILNLTAIAEPGIAGRILLIRGKFAYPILLALVVGSLGHWWRGRTKQRVAFPRRRLGKIPPVERKCRAESNNFKG